MHMYLNKLEKMGQAWQNSWEMPFLNSEIK